MNKAKKSYEPQIDAKTKKMNVGGMLIPPTNTITALLYGLGNHDSYRAKEYYFWRLCDEIWNNPERPEPMMVRHPWAEEMIRAVIRNKYIAIGGAANSGKSHTLAAWGILNWLAAPRDTLILLTSTTLREARKRIWGSVVSLLMVIEGAPIRIRDSIGNAAYVTEKGNLIERAGLSLIAAEKSKTKEAIGKFIGIKQKRVILIADELSEISEAIIQAGLSNLSKNERFELVGLSNPNSRFDAFGVWSTPQHGWDSVDTNTDYQWRTKWGGEYIRFDAERSPNVIADEVIYPWLPTTDKLNEDKALLGQESRGYYRMCRAVFFDGGEEDTIYNEAELSRSGAMSKVQWKGKPIPIAGLDPAFTNGGDRCILYTGHVGYDTNGQYVCELGEAIHLNDDATNKAVPRTYQIVRQVKQECQKRKIKPMDIAVDATGAGAPFCDVLAGEWSDEILRVSFGGKASERKVSANSKLIGSELYVNRVTELWFVGKELCRTKQIFGINGDLAQEITGRNYDMVKGATLRMKIESKIEYKARLGKSPDLADAAFLCLDLARQRHGLVAVEPLETGKTSSKPYQRRSIKGLSNMLSSQTLQGT
tara:strand:- start:1636 stop:3411 length:1776 start_codon:yes stop_codon:yes gene_type:complete